MVCLLKAAIVSSIVSNSCAISEEGILYVYEGCDGIR